MSQHAMHYHVQRGNGEGYVKQTRIDQSTDTETLMLEYLCKELDLHFGLSPDTAEVCRKVGFIL